MDILGRMGADAATAIPLLQEAAKDPVKLGANKLWTQDFKAKSNAAIKRIETASKHKAAAAKKGQKK